MSDTTEDLRITRVFTAPPEVLYDAWTRREDWAQWIGPEGVPCQVLDMDPVVGGSYLLRMELPSGEVARVSGTYKRLDRPFHVEFTWGAADPAARKETLVSLSFRAVPGGTEMVLLHLGLRTAENVESHRGGWQSTLNKLERLCQGGAK